MNEKKFAIKCQRSGRSAEIMEKKERQCSTMEMIWQKCRNKRRMNVSVETAQRKGGCNRRMFLVIVFWRFLSGGANRRVGEFSTNRQRMSVSLLKTSNE